jgi:hypothetical protein
MDKLLYLYYEYYNDWDNCYDQITFIGTTVEEIHSDFDKFFIDKRINLNARYECEIAEQEGTDYEEFSEYNIRLSLGTVWNWIDQEQDIKEMKIPCHIAGYDFGEFKND